MMRSWIVFLPMALLPFSALAQFPIPRTYEGFVFGPQPKEQAVVLEAFFDLTCPSCREGWPAVRDVVQSYGQKLRLILHPFVLPFHHNSQFAARGLHAVAAFNASLAFPWLDLVFKYQDEFSTEATWETTPSSVITRFASLAETQLGVHHDVFLQSFASSATDLATRISFKYGCLRSIVQTPSYFVNGVPVRDADDSWSVEDWKSLLDPIVFGDRNGAGFPLR